MLKTCEDRYPHNKGAQLITALELWAYGDESGIDQQVKHCLMLGYIAAPLQWERFNDLWRIALQHYGVPEFHAVDFFPRQRQRSHANPYRGWPDNQRIEFLDILLGIRAHCRLVPIGWAVNRSRAARQSARNAVRISRPPSISVKLVSGSRMRSSSKPSTSYFVHTSVINPIFHACTSGKA